jgi:hypothetical protein
MANNTIATKNTILTASNARDAAKTQHGGNQGDDEKCYCPAQHMILASSVRVAAKAASWENAALLE